MATAPTPVSAARSAPTAAEAPKKSVDRITVETVHGYPLHCSTQNVMIHAHTPIELTNDRWVQNQIKAKVLKEV